MTVGELIDAGKQVHGECRSCGRERHVDLKSLPVPRNTPLNTLSYRLKCRDCGGKQVILTVIGEEEE